MTIDAEPREARLNWASIAWTLFLVVFCFLFAVILPYRAIVQNHLLFWLIVLGGLVIGFICAASELAFALWAGEGPTSEAFRRNTRENRALARISLDPNAPEATRNHSNRRIERLSLPIMIGANYSTIYNPTLVVTNAMANIVVAVVSGAALFDKAQVSNIGTACSFDVSSLRCLDIFSTRIPIPVNTELFQSTMALTLILVVGEIIPKQLATSFPERVTRLLFPVFRVLPYLSLGTSPAFGAFGRSTAAFFHRFSSNASAERANQFTELELRAAARAARTVVCAYSGGEAPLPDWENADVREREDIINATKEIIAGAGPEELHSSWRRELTLAGWQYGPARDLEQKIDPCLQPYENLSAAQKTSLQIFTAAVTAIKEYRNEEA
jgi:Cyclin M transmembrane N-terminal domain/RyR domain